MQITYKATKTINVTLGEHYAITEFYNAGLKIQAIKFIHKQYKIDLIEAKTICEEIVLLDNLQSPNI